MGAKLHGTDLVQALQLALPMMRGPRLALLVAACLALVGCVEVFDLESPVMAGDDDNTGAGSNGSGSSSGSGSGAAARCPNGAEADGRCFERYNDATSWSVAVDRCRSRNARLAKMESASVYAAVATLVVIGDDVYLGASDKGNGDYAWLDGTSVAYNGWLPSQPSGAQDQDCLVFQHAGVRIGWVDEQCGEVMSYICERDL